MKKPNYSDRQYRMLNDVNVTPESNLVTRILTTQRHTLCECNNMQRLRYENEYYARRSKITEADVSLSDKNTHDLHNILSNIMLYVELSLEICSDDRHYKLTDFLLQSYFACESGMELLMQILSLSQADTRHAMAIDPLPTVEETVKILESTFPVSLPIHFDSSLPVIPRVAISDVHLQLLIMNLCGVCREALHGQGVITLRLKHPTNLDFNRASSKEKSFSELK